MNYPRVLILGETFRSDGGGGITLTNLFRDWPYENIGVITDQISVTNPKTNYEYYQLGSEEIKFPFPFNFVQTYFQSGPYQFYFENKHNNSNEHNQSIVFKIKKNIRPFFDKILTLSGLSSFFYSIKISESLKKWILDFQPDIIYIQPFHHKIMRFGNSLYKELKIPYAIHIMDDSVKYINKSIVFKKKLQLQIEKDFEKLICNAKGHLCISEAMSNEYSRRYGKIFLAFRNPVDVDHWLSYQKENMAVNCERLKIIYTGRLFSPTLFSLIDMCRVVDGLNRKNKMVELHIYTHDKNPTFFNSIQQLIGISVNQPVDFKDMPQLIQQYDIYFICLDFNKQAQKYSQFSISTRTSEGMISAVPVLVYAPVNSALFMYFVKTESGCTVGERNIVQLEAAILRLWNDTSYRGCISTNAVRTALSDSNSDTVREEFRKALANIKNE